jgi:hypothetical protein
LPQIVAEFEKALPAARGRDPAGRLANAQVDRVAGGERYAAFDDAGVVQCVASCTDEVAINLNVIDQRVRSGKGDSAGDRAGVDERLLRRYYFAA